MSQVEELVSPGVVRGEELLREVLEKLSVEGVGREAGLVAMVSEEGVDQLADLPMLQWTQARFCGSECPTSGLMG